MHVNLNRLIYAILLIFFALSGALTAAPCLNSISDKTCENATQLNPTQEYDPSKDPAYAGWMETLFPSSAENSLKRTVDYSLPQRTKRLLNAPRAPQR